MELSVIVLLVKLNIYWSEHSYKAKVKEFGLKKWWHPEQSLPNNTILTPAVFKNGYVKHV